MVCWFFLVLISFWQMNHWSLQTKTNKKAMLLQGNCTVPLQISICIKIYSGITQFSLWWHGFLFLMWLKITYSFVSPASEASPSILSILLFCRYRCVKLTFLSNNGILVKVLSYRYNTARLWHATNSSLCISSLSNSISNWQCSMTQFTTFSMYQ